MAVKSNYIAVIGLMLLFFYPHVTNSQSTLNPAASFLGTHYAERVGYHLHTAGDVNGDGYDDFLIGTFHNHAKGTNTGAAYLILGRKEADWDFNYSLKSADARFIGGAAYDAAGYCLGGGGDINGDGYDDFLIGAPAGDEQVISNPGHVYIIFGKPEPYWNYNYVLPSQADVSFDGEKQHDLAGLSVAIIGDINGDGYDDFICGAPYSDYYRKDSGKAYLIMGKPTGWSKKINLQDADASFYGTSYNETVGYSVDGVGDVNGDGVPDFAIGARKKGKVYIFFGRKNVDWGKNCAVTRADVVFSAEQYESWVGWRVSRAGDINADGFDDILIGAPFYNKNGDKRGKVYLIFGRSNGWFENLRNADASFLGEAENDQAGWDVQEAGDTNGDGYDDFLIGAWYNDSNGEDSGKMYLIKGKPLDWKQNFSLKNVQDYFIGEHTIDYAGFSVSRAGDVNGDGWDDIITSSTYCNQGAHWAGKILLFVSENPDPPIPELLVTPASLDFHTHNSTKSFTVSNNGYGVLKWSAVENPDESWIVSVNPAGGILTMAASQKVTVTIAQPEPAKLIHTGIISITSNGGSQDVGVTFSLNLIPEISVTPQALNFGSTISSKSFMVENIGAGTLNWSATENPDLSWITSIEPPKGSLIMDQGLLVTVTVDRHALSDGNYSNLIKISSNGGKREIAVNMKVLKPASCRLQKQEENNIYGYGDTGDSTYTTNGLIIPQTPTLYQNYPNPFNPQTTIEFTLPFRAKVNLNIINLQGEQVSSVLNSVLASGHHSIVWNASKNQGSLLPTGVYFYQIHVIRESQQEQKLFKLIKKMLLLK